MVQSLALLSGAAWVAVLVSMLAFAENAEEIDEGVNVEALFLALVALILMAMTLVVALRSQHQARRDDRGSGPAA